MSAGHGDIWTDHMETTGIIGVSMVYSAVQAQIKENLKAPRPWPLWGEFTGDRRIPRIKGQ